MRWITEEAKLACEHGGRVTNKPSQDWVRIERRRVLVATDPEGRTISACPNANPPIGIRPCVTTLVVKTGYSNFVRVEGHRVCLETIGGLTDGSPPGIVNYRVLDPAQKFVAAKA